MSPRSDSDRLDGIEHALHELVSQFAVHAETHKAISDRMEHFHADMYEEKGGLKMRMALMEQTCAGRHATPPPSRLSCLCYGVAEKALAGGILAFVGWLLYLYSVSAKH